MIQNRFTRFLASGVVNTIVTYALYLLLLKILNYTVAYTVAYLLGIILAYYLNLKYVFNAKSSKNKIMLYPIIYLMQYLFAVIFLYFVVEKLFMPKEFAPLIVIILSIPLVYFLNKIILLRS